MDRMPADERTAAPRRGDGLRRAVLAALASCLLASLSPAAWAAPELDSNLANLSLEELANLQVTSVSKKAESLADAAASVYVITNDDIRRSGARSLPEALRLAPNLQVAQENAQAWAISARGGGATSADKLLVLIDGRIVYTPLFSGVFWNDQNVMLQDIDRIEVISGPGGTLWGTNALNGVINIITKGADATGGTLASAGGGRYGADLAARYGGELGGGGSYRAYAMLSDSYTTTGTTGQSQHDGSNLAQAGFRSDWGTVGHSYTLQGDAYGINADQRLPGGNERDSGLNLVNHWDTTLEGGSELSLLGYYDRINIYVPTDFGEKLDIADVELQQSLPETHAQDFIWGASYRYTRDNIQNLPGSTLAFLPAQVNQAWSSLFAQDEAHLSPSVRLIGGARLEHNPYTGTEFLPNLRVAWNLDSEGLLWGAVSRAVRSPSRLDVNLYSPEQPPFFLTGNPAYRSETARVYELSYRGQAGGAWSYSATLYHYNYYHLRTEDLESLAPLQVTFRNDMTESETGAELWGSYQPLPEWRLSAGLNTLRQARTLTSAAALPSSASTEGDDPSAEWSLRSNYLFPGGVELDVSVRHVSALPAPALPAYTTADVRVGWTIGPHWACSVLARNLFGPTHVEFATTPGTPFGRGLYLKFEWRP